MSKTASASEACDEKPSISAIEAWHEVRTSMNTGEMFPADQIAYLRRCAGVPDDR
jgi:hypothetical protein